MQPDHQQARCRHNPCRNRRAAPRGCIHREQHGKDCRLDPPVLVRADAALLLPPLPEIPAEMDTRVGIKREPRGMDEEVQNEVRQPRDPNRRDDHAVALVTSHQEIGGVKYQDLGAHVVHMKDGKVTESWFFNWNPYQQDELFPR